MNLTKPVIGKAYQVPCVFGTPSFFSIHLRVNQQMNRWYPVFTPSHEDSEYIRRQRFVWRRIDESKQILEKEFYYEHDPSTLHHYHLDDRFIPAEWAYLDRHASQERITYNGVIFSSEVNVEFFELKCIREQCATVNPESILGKSFAEKYINKPMKCERCPHKGIDLSSIHPIDGVITCPAHGLKFSLDNQCSN